MKNEIDNLENGMNKTAIFAELNKRAKTLINDWHAANEKCGTNGFAYIKLEFDGRVHVLGTNINDVDRIGGALHDLADILKATPASVRPKILMMIAECLSLEG